MGVDISTPVVRTCLLRLNTIPCELREKPAKVEPEPRRVMDSPRGLDLTALDVAVEMHDFGQAELHEVLAFVRCIQERDLPTVIDLDRRRRPETTEPRRARGFPSE
jgi:hypothetical protein